MNDLMYIWEVINDPVYKQMVFAALVALGSVGYIIFSIKKAMSYDKPNDRPPDVGFLGEGSIRYPGYMSYAPIGSTDSLTGCYCALFRNVDDLNAYFAPGKAGFLSLVVDLKPLGNGEILAVMNKVLSEEEKEDLKEWSYLQHQAFQAKRMERLHKKAEAEQARLQKAEEEKKYIEMGRHCEHNHKKSRDQ